MTPREAAAAAAADAAKELGLAPAAIMGAVLRRYRWARLHPACAAAYHDSLARGPYAAPTRLGRWWHARRAKHWHAVAGMPCTGMP